MTIHIQRRKGIPKLDTGLLRRRIARLMKLLQVDQKELSVLFTEDREMTDLNRSYRNKNRTTDVLSFAQSEGPRGELHPEILGDVVISVPTAKRQARERRHTLTEELIILLVHGVLHLLGHEHERTDRKTRALMQKEQERLVAILTSQSKR